MWTVDDTYLYKPPVIMLLGSGAEWCYCVLYFPPIHTPYMLCNQGLYELGGGSLNSLHDSTVCPCRAWTVGGVGPSRADVEYAGRAVEIPCGRVTLQASAMATWLPLVIGGKK